MYCIASSQTAKRRVVQPVHSLCWQEDTKMHGLLGTGCTQTSSFGCISHGTLEILPWRAWCIASSLAPKHRVVQTVRSLRRQGGTFMRGLPGTDCTQAFPCACNRPEGMSCCLYRLHHVHYLNGCESDSLPVPRHQSIARCSLFILPGGKGHVDAWPSWHRLHTDISVCEH